jgi:hypothetical protein
MENILSIFKVKTQETKKYQNKLIKFFIGILISIILFYSSGLRFPVIDSKTDQYFYNSIKKAGLAYVTCRGVNSVVSVLKGSDLQIGPGGVGVSISVGEVLDPIDDMTERLSDVLVTAITSLGVQKLIYEISISIALPVLSIILLIITLMLLFDDEKYKKIQNNLVKISLLVIIFRFFLPVSSMANDFLYNNFFSDQINSANKDLESSIGKVDGLDDFSLPDTEGIIGTIKNNAYFLAHKTGQFKDAFVTTVSNAHRIIENLLELTFLYVGVFVIQVILLPLLSFWLITKLTNFFFNTNIPFILKKNQLNLEKNQTEIVNQDGQQI